MPWWRSRAAIVGGTAIGVGLISVAVFLGVRPQPETVGGQPVECPSVISGYFRPGGDRASDEACDVETQDDLLVVVDVAAVGIALTVSAFVLHRQRRSVMRSRGTRV